MKKLLLLLTAFLTMSLVSAQAVFTDGDYTFTQIGSTDFCEITSYTYSGTAPAYDITTPATAYNIAEDFTYTCTVLGENLFFQTNGITSIVVSPGILEIKKQALRQVYDCTSITIPEGVTTFGLKVFAASALLESMVLPNSITTWGTENFTGCAGLSSLTLGSGITSINNRMINGTTSLVSLTIPATITAFDQFSFRATSTLTTLIMEGSIPPVIDPVVDGVSVGWLGNPANITAYVPDADVATYLAANIWEDMTIKAVSTLSTNSVELALGLSVYPNPTNGIVNIKNSNNTNADVTVFDLNGRALLKTTNSSVDISNLAAGLYIFRVKTDQGQLVKRILKQ